MGGRRCLVPAELVSRCGVGEVGGGFGRLLQFSALLCDAGEVEGVDGVGSPAPQSPRRRSLRNGPRCTKLPPMWSRASDSAPTSVVARLPASPWSTTIWIFSRSSNPSTDLHQRVCLRRRRFPENSARKGRTE